MIQTVTARLVGALLVLLSFTLFSQAGLAAGDNDRLQRAAPVVAGAEQALLLDITRAGERLVAVGEQGIVLLSDDGGQQWRQAQVPVSVLLTAVQFVDANNGWSVGHDGVVLRSTDGGEHWERVLESKLINRERERAVEAAIEQLDDQAPDYNARLETMEYALDDARFAREDNASPPLLDLWFFNANEGLVSGAYGTLLKTKDGGQSWQSLDHELPNPDRLHLNALYAAEERFYLLGEAGLLISGDLQQSQWQEEDSPYQGSFFAMQQADALYLMGLRGHLFRSGEEGDWQPVKLPSQATLTGGAVGPQGELWLFGQGGLVLRQDGDKFSKVAAPVRTSFSAGVIHSGHLVLVGESGVLRLPLVNTAGKEARS